MENYTVEGNFKQTKREDRIAVIGSRKATKELKQVSYDLGKKLAHEGKWIVNTFAKGIDRCAILGAIDACKEGATGGVIVVEPEYYLYAEDMNYDILEDVKKYGYIIHPYSEEQLDSINLNKVHNSLYEFENVSILSVDRSRVASQICNELYIVSDESVITGGSRCALTSMSVLDRKLSQYFSDERGVQNLIDINPIKELPSVTDVDDIEVLIGK